MKILYLLISCGFLFTACFAQKSHQKKGILQGQVGEYVGNCMPAPDTPPCKPQPLAATIMISELSRDYDPTIVVDSIASNEEGFFLINLPEGSYSLFIKDADSYTCTGIKCPSECYCMPVKITPDSTTRIEINLDHATW